MSDITKSRIQTFKNKGKDQEVNVVKIDKLYLWMCF